MDILLTSRPNFFKAAFGQIIGFTIMIILGVSLLGSGEEMGVMFSVGGLIALFLSYLKFRNMVLTIDTKKCIFRSGILSKNTTEVKHEDVRQIKIQQSFIERIFDIGSCKIYSAGTNDAEIDIIGVEEYTRIKDIVNSQRDKLESGKNTKKNTSGSVDDFANQMKKLGDLKNQGIITEEEFNNKKEELLAKI